MSETNVYLVPTDEPYSQKRRIGAEVITFLEANGIIEGFYDEPKGWYAQGAQAGDIYENPKSFGFEYALVYDSAAAKLIPEIGYGFPRCPRCGSDIVESIHDLSEAKLDDEAYDAWDMSEVSVPCAACNSLVRLEELASVGQTMLARFWIEFDCADGDEISSKFMRELSSIIGADLVVMYERM